MSKGHKLLFLYQSLKEPRPSIFVPCPQPTRPPSHDKVAGDLGKEGIATAVSLQQGLRSGGLSQKNNRFPGEGGLASNWKATPKMSCIAHFVFRDAGRCWPQGPVPRCVGRRDRTSGGAASILPRSSRQARTASESPGPRFWGVHSIGDRSRVPDV